ncbi:MAG TPA: GNAT family N-acetyltransferase [Chloroflexota bacterium]|nr:GNAT family N-acetyltransferase [Chloroflexota bacterium]
MEESIPSIPFDIDIREQTPDQLPLVVEINNASVPPDDRTTEEQARIEDGLSRPEEPPLRLIAWLGDRPVATGYAGRSIFTAEGRCRITIRVLPDFRRQGVATRIYRRLVSFARESDAKSLLAGVSQESLPLVQQWLQREGYYEVERMRPSRLTLETMDWGSWAESEERVIGQGIALTTLAQEDSEANRRKLWELSETTRIDVPHHPGGQQPFPFEKFDDLLNRPEARPGCLVIAKNGDAYVGFSLLVHQTADEVLTGMTGVLRDYRSRGIALALKVRSARLAHAKGYKSMRTMNHVNNPAMLKVNDRLGYVALPHFIMFQKDLRHTARVEVGVASEIADGRRGPPGSG